MCAEVDEREQVKLFSRLVSSAISETATPLLAHSMHVQVVVLGDFGRSPRMQYHALSLATQADCEVTVVAYEGSPPQQALLDCPRIHYKLMSPPPKRVDQLPRVVALVVKLIYMTCSLLYLLLAAPHADFLLLQSPPCIPTFLFCRLACTLRRTKFVIDWHNFGYTILALSLRAGHPFVRFAHWYERYFGRSADANLCVTHAMKDELHRWGLRGSIHVLHDKPAAIFRRASLEETHALFLSLQPALAAPPGGGVPPAAAQGPPEDARPDFLVAAAAKEAARCRPEWDRSPVTTAASSTAAPRWRSGRPALVVSSTSWTPDEDFGVLLEAACLYDAALQAAPDPTRPDLLICVTGKGPQRAMYEAKMRGLSLHHVAFRTLWLSFEDYACLLGSADLGVCLHTSSSGLDLPMKVVDMFGCSLPVAAVRYSTIHELVAEGSTGRLFDSPQDLADTLLDLFADFHRGAPELHRLRNGVVKASSATWQTCWAQNALPVFRPQV